MRPSPQTITNWLQALRSNQYKQGKHCLKYRNKYCCLGVLCKIQGFSKGILDDEFPPPETLFELGLPNILANKYAFLNDTGKTFTEIAFEIEQDFEIFPDFSENPTKILDQTKTLD